MPTQLLKKRTRRAEYNRRVTHGHDLVIVTERPKPNPAPTSDSKGGGRMFATFALFALFTFAASGARNLNMRKEKEKKTNEDRAATQLYRQAGQPLSGDSLQSFWQAPSTPWRQSKQDKENKQSKHHPFFPLRLSRYEAHMGRFVTIHSVCRKAQIGDNVNLWLLLLDVELDSFINLFKTTDLGVLEGVPEYPTIPMHAFLCLVNSHSYASLE
jgi:hypothetical protein